MHRGEMQSYVFPGREAEFVPYVLHGLLDDVHMLQITKQKQTKPAVISWLSDGRAFVIQQKNLFTHHLLRPYFDLSSWDEFISLLREWGFVVSEGIGDDSPTIFAHPLFVRGKLFLCSQMTRTRLSSRTSETHREDSMNFYGTARVVSGE